mmetsp:Transcript_17153/g.28500  ORF Transcript_17153/g.28500 Transcript_17153/m.28500 type:complete len:254 (+) Transcript_17153:1098-1859(+)
MPKVANREFAIGDEAQVGHHDWLYLVFAEIVLVILPAMSSAICIDLVVSKCKRMVSVVKTSYRSGTGRAPIAASSTASTTAFLDVVVGNVNVDERRQEENDLTQDRQMLQQLFILKSIRKEISSNVETIEESHEVRSQQIIFCIIILFAANSIRRSTAMQRSVVLHDTHQILHRVSWRHVWSNKMKEASKSLNVVSVEATTTTAIVASRASCYIDILDVWSSIIADVAAVLDILATLLSHDDDDCDQYECWIP